MVIKCNFNKTMSYSNIQNKFLKINGAIYLFKATFTILELVDYLGFNKNLIVIDYNGIVLEKKVWQLANLKNGDSLEIISIAGGG